MTFPVLCAVEGRTDEPVAARLLAEVGLTLELVKIARGKHQIDQGLPGWNDSAAHRPWLVLRDLDHDDQTRVFQHSDPNNWIEQRLGQ